MMNIPGSKLIELLFAVDGDVKRCSEAPAVEVEGHPEIFKQLDYVHLSTRRSGRNNPSYSVYTTRLFFGWTVVDKMYFALILAICYSDPDLKREGALNIPISDLKAITGKSRQNIHKRLGQMLKALYLLKIISFQTSKGGKHKQRSCFNIITNESEIKGGQLHIEFTSSFWRIITSHSHPFSVPKSLFTVNLRKYPHVFNLVIKALMHAGLNQGKKNQFTLRVLSLVSSCPDLAHKVYLKTSKSLKERLITPFLNNLGGISEFQFQLHDRNKNNISMALLPTRWNTLANVRVHFLYPCGNNLGGKKY